MARVVKIVRTDGEAALIELDLPETGDLRRCVVPLKSVRDGQVSERVAELAVPWGVQWEDRLAGNWPSGPERLAAELRRRGLWCAEDVLARPKSVSAAVQAAYGVDLSAILRIAREVLKSG